MSIAISEIVRLSLRWMRIEQKNLNKYSGELNYQSCEFWQRQLFSWDHKDVYWLFQYLQLIQLIVLAPAQLADDI